jgi:hypothetical protein
LSSEFINVADGELKCEKLTKMMILGPMEKVDGSEFFGVDFDQICQKSDLYGFMEKQAPQKALCLGPDPPLGFSINFIDFYRFLRFLTLQ